MFMSALPVYLFPDPDVTAGDDASHDRDQFRLFFRTDIAARHGRTQGAKSCGSKALTPA
jgi:hypothetical protein